MAEAVRRLNEPGIRKAIIVVVATTLLAAIFTYILLETRPHAELWDWLITFAATGLSALLALSLFGYQSWQTEQDQQKRLLEALAAELQSNLDIIRHEHRTPFFGRLRRQGQKVRYVKYAEAKLVPMEPIAGDAAIRSGAFAAEDVYLLTRIVREMHVHNSEVAYLSATRLHTSVQHADAIIFATKELNERQERIAAMCEELIEFLRTHEGIEVPTSPDMGSSSGNSSG